MPTRHAPERLHHLGRNLAFATALAFAAIACGVEPEEEAAESTTSDYTIFLPVVTKNSSAASSALGALNAERARARTVGAPNKSLAPVVEDPVFSNGDRLHSIYMVKNDVVAHSEEPNEPYYTAEGNAAAGASNVLGSSDIAMTDQDAIDLWMQAPFHALGMLDPELLKTGYGAHREAGPGLQAGAALDVIRGLGPLPAETQFPIAWPGPGTTVGLTKHTTEWPSPLTSCPGYTTPSGLPILLQLGSGNVTPNVTATSFSLKNGASSYTALAHCVFDETTYAGVEPALAKGIMGGRDAVVIIPKAPLSAGKTYKVSVTSSGATHAWEFSVGGAPRDAMAGAALAAAGNNANGNEIELGRPPTP